MQPKIARWYLYMVPVLALILAFAVGHVPYQYYVPVWMLNSLLMLQALRILSAGTRPAIRTFAWLSVLPWVAFTIFAGMGRPPQTTEGWALLATEQEVRFAILIAGSISVMLGLSVIGQALREAGAGLRGQLAVAAGFMATPLFIINMAFWGACLPIAMQHFMASGAPEARPDLWAPLKYLFFEIASVAGLLYYLCALLLAAGLAQVGWMKPRSARVVGGICIVAMVLSILPPGLPTPLDVLSYFVSIPAIGFLLFYYMALHLLSLKDKEV
ncbi:hypothetical protein DCC81_21865 [Chitinophaga parva]|uniref:Uncharacterized protein n=1 Tax=Chitinophaga parva TaxID=2169414 RepID=A0A2T7BD84_9BACT|nr:hypothetical protein [Chitinophaga parva]PUZ23054.1 hypothetical protein DCC81_21865 [Chitinophaga parva]